MTSRFFMVSIRKRGNIRTLMCQERQVSKAACYAIRILILISISGGLLLFTGLKSGAEDLVTNRPRARVVIVDRPGVTEAFRPRMEAVREMVNRGITNLTRKASTREAWLSLVSTQDVVGLKVYSAPGPNSGTRPGVVAAIVEGLL